MLSRFFLQLFQFFVKCRRTSLMELSKEIEKLVVVTFSLLLSLQLREPTFPNASSTDYKDHFIYKNVNLLH